MLTEKQLKIFEVFAKRPFAEHTRQQIKEEANAKSNNAMALTINLLKKENIIAEKKIGKSGLLTLNIDNDLTFQYIAICNNNRLPHIAKVVLINLKEDITEITPFYSIAIFGSYAEGKQKPTSDLDVAIFIESESTKKHIEAAVNSAKLKSPVGIDAHVISKEEMIKMLTDKEENLGKQIARKHLAAYNNQIFYEIVKEGIKHGFRA